MLGQKVAEIAKEGWRTGKPFIQFVVTQITDRP